MSAHIFHKDDDGTSNFHKALCCTIDSNNQTQEELSNWMMMKYKLIEDEQISLPLCEACILLAALNPELCKQ